MTPSDHPQEHCPHFFEACPYPVFDEKGTPILACGNTHCTDAKGNPYYPASTHCVNLKCEKRFRPVCPAAIYCSQQCFEVTNTHEYWLAAKTRLKKDNKAERKKQLERERHVRYLKTEAGHQHRSEQNKRCYLRRKEAGKIQAAYEKRKSLQSHADACEFANTKHPFSIGTTDTTKSGAISCQVPSMSNDLLQLASTSASLQMTESTACTPLCRYPGCDTVVTYDRTYWGKDKKYCTKRHREKMTLHLLRLKRLTDITQCPFMLCVFTYLRLAAGQPAPSHQNITNGCVCKI